MQSSLELVASAKPVPDDDRLMCALKELDARFRTESKPTHMEIVLRVDDYLWRLRTADGMQSELRDGD